MTPSELKQHFENRHQEALQEFGSAEKEFNMDQVRVWDIEAVVDHVGDIDGQAYEFENPVPVYSNGNQVGSAVLDVAGTTVTAKAFVEYGIPERLDVENGKSLYLKVHGDPNQQYPRARLGVEALPGVVFKVTSLEFTDEPQPRGYPVAGAL